MKLSIFIFNPYHFLYFWSFRNNRYEWETVEDSEDKAWVTAEKTTLWALQLHSPLRDTTSWLCLRSSHVSDILGNWHLRGQPPSPQLMDYHAWGCINPHPFLCYHSILAIKTAHRKTQLMCFKEQFSWKSQFLISSSHDHRIIES